MDRIVDMFKQYLVDEGKANGTIKAYVRDVRLFYAYLDEREVEYKNVYMKRFYFTSYIRHLKNAEKKFSTINTKMASLKVFNDWLFKMKFVDKVYINLRKDKIRTEIGSEKQVVVLTDEELEKFLFYLEKEKQREKVWGYLLVYTGIRASEMMNIKLTDIDPLFSVLTIVGKQGKLREVPLRSEVLEVIEQYIKGDRAKNRFSGSEYLFISQRASRVDRATLGKWLESVSDRLHIHLHPHKFRHTFCTLLLKRGVDLTVVSKLVGHSSINLTMRYYIHITKEEKREAVELI